MAVISMQKIKLLASTAHRLRLLETLQSQGVMEVTEILDEEEQKNIELKSEAAVEKEPVKLEAAHNAELNIANIDFALKMIKPFAKQRSILEGPPVLTIEEVKEKAKTFDFNKTVNKCRQIEEVIVSLRNEEAGLSVLQEELEPWQNLSMPLGNISETENTKTVAGYLQKTDYTEFEKDVKEVSDLISVEKINEDESTVYCIITFMKDLEKDLKETLSTHKFSEVELPQRKHDVKEELKIIKNRKGEIEKDLKMQNEELKVLAKNNEDLQIVHDYYVWERDRIYADRKAKNTDYTFVMEGWVPVRNMKKLKSKLEEVTKTFELYEIAPREDETAPVAIRNKGVFGTFEAVTNIYGLPMPDEVDPTPFLASFFIIFFGLCLTDAGYGILLFVICALALKFLKLGGGMKKLVKLLMIGGIVTFVLGVLFGGWFGMTAEQAPDFLTYQKTLESGEIVEAFKWQIITPAQGTGPLTFLILAAILGYIQVLFGIIIDGYWKIRQNKVVDAVFDSFLWVYFLIVIMLFGLSRAGIFLTDYADAITYLVYFGVGALILTQGRKQKNIVLKFFSGVLSLYGLVGYFADVLSYSRLMALGLGTGIIGFAFNTIGGLVGNIPVVGIIFAIIVILIGHLLNIAISTLGAFIHSSRLQFVEFFGKFMEGGGRAFTPFKKACKYIMITGKK
jgi:V/A-type H+-transporting ATPase subunit I